LYIGGGGDISAANAEPEATAKANDEASKNLFIATPMRERNAAPIYLSQCHTCVSEPQHSPKFGGEFTPPNQRSICPRHPEDFRARMHRLSRVSERNHLAMLKS
jgi:hypothetical protein